MPATAPGAHRRTELRRLLLELFTPEELRLLLDDHAERLVEALPAEGVSPAWLAHEAVKALANRGLVNAQLFELLLVERPNREARISECMALWQDAMRDAPEHDAALRRYRAAITAGHATMHIVGFPLRGKKPSTLLTDLCVPLRMSRGESVKPWMLARLVDHLTERDRVRRVVVLGGPGSGKTTLCKYLTVLLAGSEPSALVPLHVPLREYLRAGAGALLHFLCDRAGDLQAKLPVDALEHACEVGRAVLIVDGLDEVGDAVARSEMRDRLNAFMRLYPRVSLLVTSREVGYHEAPLAEAGEEAFLQLTMASLDDAEKLEFVRRWYAATEPDPDARERGTADLIAGIRAHPAIQGLADNRMMLTLIALIHRQEARLPGERVTLYEQCVQMFLGTWPGARNQRFTAIPQASQRRLLEQLAAALVDHRELAARQQERRHARFLAALLVDSGAGAEDALAAMTPLDGGSMERRRLVALLADRLRTEGPGDEAIEARVEAWIDFLHEQSGLLSDVHPGVYQFVHRTLEEYLTACWYRNTSEDVVEVVVAGHRSSTRHEILRMLVGCIASDGPACARLFERMSAQHGAEDESWLFLLDCLAEEASFPPVAVWAILERTLGISTKDTSASPVEQAIARLCRFSARHGATVRAWLRRSIESGPCEVLARPVWAAVVATRVEEVIEWLDARADRSLAAATLAASVWPLDGSVAWIKRPEMATVGRWAWTHTSLEDAVTMVEGGSIPTTEICLAAVMAIMTGQSGAIAGALALELALDAITLTEAVRSAWPDVKAIVCEPPRLELPIATRAPLGAQGASWRLCAGIELERRWILGQGHFSPALRDDGAVDLEIFTNRFQGVTLFDYLIGLDEPTPDDFWADAVEPYGSNCFSEPDDYGDYEQYDPGNDYPLKEFERDAVRAIDPRFAIPSLSAGDAGVPPPCSPQDPGPYRLRARMRALRDELGQRRDDPLVDATLVDIALEVHTLHAAHAVVAARVPIESLAPPAIASVLRQQHAWVLQNWHVVDRSNLSETSPEGLALVLALGWSQCLTTMRWPATPRWRALFAGPPPAHWWPRVHWHVCWSIAAPGDAGHRAAITRALAEGAGDPVLGTLARRLRMA